jgi:hypothetical protein
MLENRFCSNCGQENTDTRKTFHHLFIHFFEDLTHYENAFGKLLKSFETGTLTNAYLPVNDCLIWLQCASIFFKFHYFFFNYRIS